MDYSELNKMLSNLEINSDQNELKEISQKNHTNLSRDLLLKNNFRKMNFNLVNPQRDFIHINKKEEDLNSKIQNYNFIQKKKFLPSDK